MEESLFVYLVSRLDDYKVRGSACCIREDKSLSVSCVLRDDFTDRSL